MIKEIFYNIAHARYKMQVTIPGTDFVKGQEIPEGGLALYLQGIFSFLIWGAIILAMLMIVVGGFYYLTSAGNASRSGEGKDRIKWAIYGLILALSSYVILNFINPDLVRPKLPGIEDKYKIKPEDKIDLLRQAGIPRAGDKDGRITEGGVCYNDDDCSYSLKCKDDAEKFKYYCSKTKKEHNEISRTYYGTLGKTKCQEECSTSCTETKAKTCQKVTQEEAGGLVLAYDPGCDTTKKPEEKQCYDEELTCNYFEGICMLPRTSGYPCMRPSDCISKICDNKICVASETPEEAEEGGESAKEGVGSVKFVSSPVQKLFDEEEFITRKNELYSLFIVPFYWLPSSEIKSRDYDTKLVSQCEKIGVPDPPGIGNQPTFKFKAINQHEINQFIGWIESGYQFYKGTDSVEPIKCSVSYGYSDFKNREEKFCQPPNRKTEPANNQLNSEQENENCCALGYKCARPPIHSRELCSVLNGSDTPPNQYTANLSYSACNKAHKESRNEQEVDFKIGLEKRFLDNAETEDDYIICCSRIIPPSRIQLRYPEHKECYKRANGLPAFGIKLENNETCNNFCEEGESGRYIDGECCVCEAAPFDIFEVPSIPAELLNTQQ